MELGTEITMQEEYTNTVTISTDEYAYLIECQVRLDLLREMRLRNIKTTAQYGPSPVMPEDLVLGNDIVSSIEGSGHD